MVHVPKTTGSYRVEHGLSAAIMTLDLIVVANINRGLETEPVVFSYSYGRLSIHNNQLISCEDCEDQDFDPSPCRHIDYQPLPAASQRWQGKSNFFPMGNSWTVHSGPGETMRHLETMDFATVDTVPGNTMVCTMFWLRREVFVWIKI